MTNRSSSHRWVYFFIQNGFAANASILSYFKGSWGFCIGSNKGDSNVKEFLRTSIHGTNGTSSRCHGGVGVGCCGTGSLESRHRWFFNNKAGQCLSLNRRRDRSSNGSCVRTFVLEANRTPIYLLLNVHPVAPTRSGRFSICGTLIGMNPVRDYL